MPGFSATPCATMPGSVSSATTRYETSPAPLLVPPESSTTSAAARPRAAAARSATASSATMPKRRGLAAQLAHGVGEHLRVRVVDPRGLHRLAGRDDLVARGDDGHHGPAPHVHGRPRRSRPARRCRGWSGPGPRRSTVSPAVMSVPANDTPLPAVIARRIRSSYPTASGSPPARRRRRPPPSRRRRRRAASCRPWRWPRHGRGARRWPARSRCEAPRRRGARGAAPLPTRRRCRPPPRRSRPRSSGRTTARPPATPRRRRARAPGRRRARRARCRRGEASTAARKRRSASSRSRTCRNCSCPGPPKPLATGSVIEPDVHVGAGRETLRCRRPRSRSRRPWSWTRAARRRTSTAAPRGPAPAAPGRSPAGRSAS